MDTNSPATDTQTVETEERGKKRFGASENLLKLFRGDQDNNSEVKESTEVKEGDETSKETKSLDDPKTPEQVEATKQQKSYEQMSKEDVANISRQWQSRYDKTVNDYKKLESITKELDSQLRYVMENPAEAFKQIAPELAPQTEYNQDIDSNVTRWQQTDLLPYLMKKFPNEVEEGWQPVPEDIFRPGTATYEFNRITQIKHADIESNRMQYEERAQQRKQQDIQMKQYVDTKYKEDLDYMITEFKMSIDEVKQLAKEYDDITASSNDPFGDHHYQRAKNIFKSVFFDKLTDRKVKNAVNEAVNKVHNEYKSRGIQFRNDTPVDLGQFKPKDAHPETKNQFGVNRYVKPTTKLFDHFINH